ADHFTRVRDLPARVGPGARGRTDVYGDRAAPIENCERLFVGLAGADVDRKRAAHAGEQTEDGAPHRGSFRDRFDRIVGVMQEETLRRDELAELLGGSDANLRFRMPDVERETPDPILDDNARRLQRGHARTGAPQLLHGRLGALEIRFGHHSQATSLHVGAVDADVGKAMQPQPALERLHLARGEHRAARVGRRAEPDQRCARSASTSCAGTTAQMAMRVRSKARSRLSMQKKRQSASRRSLRSSVARVRPRIESIAYTSMAQSARAASTSWRCSSAGPSDAAHFAAKRNWRFAISAPRRSAASRPTGAGKWRGSDRSSVKRITASISGISPFIARLKIIPGISSRLISFVPSKMRLTRL